MQLSLNEKEKAIEEITYKLLQTNIAIENPQKMAIDLLDIYNWDIQMIAKYAL